MNVGQEKVVESLKAAWESPWPLMEAHANLQTLADSGVSAEEILTALEDIRRTEPPEELDDFVLEVMDFVSGWCSPHMKVRFAS